MYNGYDDYQSNQQSRSGDRDNSSSYSSSFYAEESVPTLLRADTVDTIISVNDILPDVSIHCLWCKEFIFGTKLTFHRNFHNALTYLGFKGNFRKPTIDQLTYKRKSCIKKALECVKESEKLKKLKYIDVAFDNALRYITEQNLPRNVTVSQELMKELEEIRSSCFACSVEMVAGIGLAVSFNQFACHNFTDRLVYQDNFGSDPNKCFLSVLSGHDGDHAVNFVSEKLHSEMLKTIHSFDSQSVCMCQRNCAQHLTQLHQKYRRDLHANAQSHNEENQKVRGLEQIPCEHMLDNLLSRLSQDQAKSFATPPSINQDYVDQMESAFTKIHSSLEEQLKTQGEKTYSANRWSGCSHVTLLIHQYSTDQTRLHLCNCGPLRCMLIRANEPGVLTEDHSTNNRQERQRLREIGAQIEKSLKTPIFETSYLVEGTTDVTRCLGCHGDSELKRGLISKPYFTSLNLDNNCQAIVLGSAGIWKALSSKEVASVVKSHLPCNRLRQPSNQSIDSLLMESSGSEEPLSYSSSDVTETETESNEIVGQMNDAMYAAEEMSRHIVELALMTGSKDNLTAAVLLLMPGL